MTQTVIVVIYLGLLLSLGYLSSRLFRGNSNDYFVASRSIGPLVLFMSIFGTTMTAFAMVGSTGESYRVGIATYGKIASSSSMTRWNHRRPHSLRMRWIKRPRSVCLETPPLKNRQVS